MSLAPIVLFIYNRPWHTEQTLISLEQNDLADESTLYIFADGPRQNSGVEDLNKIEQTRSVAKSKNWCKKVEIIEQDINIGLADSIVNGVTKIVNEYGKIIVLEDDLVTSKGFLTFMNDALSFYELNEKVCHVSGYMNPHTQKLPETFFFNVPMCWGWATWKRAWNFYISDTEYLFDYFDKKNQWGKFNKFGGTYLENQLRENKSGKIKTWFIKWHASLLIKNAFTLFPGLSFVNNIGFDNTGTNTVATNKFNHTSLAVNVSIQKIPLKETKLAGNITREFYNNLFTNINEPPISVITKIHKGMFKYFPFKKLLQGLIQKVMIKLFPELSILKEKELNWNAVRSIRHNVVSGKHNKFYPPYQICDSTVGDYTYIAQNACISGTTIGKFCSIGPNLLCGWGIHPTNTLTTSPMFYSRMKQNGTTLSAIDKIEERKPISIGNDVFIGANVTILDGVSIGDGAIIGAGAVVSKNIPPYAIAVGCPINIIRYRFSDENIENLMAIKWWDFNDADLQEIEKYFDNVDSFIAKYKNA